MLVRKIHSIAAKIVDVNAWLLMACGVGLFISIVLGHVIGNAYCVKTLMAVTVPVWTLEVVSGIVRLITAWIIVSPNKDEEDEEL